MCFKCVLPLFAEHTLSFLHILGAKFTAYFFNCSAVASVWRKLTVCLVTGKNEARKPCFNRILREQKVTKVSFKCILNVVKAFFGFLHGMMGAPHYTGGMNGKYMWSLYKVSVVFTVSDFNQH
jgi:hypothetical protein